MKSTAILAVSAALLLAGPAHAEDCALKMLASVDLIPAPGGARVLVPVTINDVAKRMLLNTGGGFTTLTAATVDQLKLHPLDSSHLRLLDSAGNASRRYVYAQSFQMGTLRANDLPIMVTPGADAGGDGTFDGVLAGDFMAHYDIELDFAARKMNYFSHDHCAGHVVYWPATTIAVVPFRTQRPLLPSIPGERPRFQVIQDTHIRVPVTLDGKEFLAVISTGTGRSTMDADTARIEFGVTDSSPGSVPMGSIDHDPKHKAFGHVFGSLTFDGITVNNPHIVIIPDLVGAKDPDNGYATGSRIVKVDDGIGPQLTIGMDVLRHLHLYVSFDERKLYITAANGPTPVAAADGNAAAAAADTPKP